LSTDLPPAERDAFQAIVRQLETAWNALDGHAFAAPFAADADFVNVRGEHFQGRAAIAAGHVGIFRSIYAGSRNQYTVEGLRLLRPEWRWYTSAPGWMPHRVPSQGRTRPSSP
jgi:uncharacterized protein (TIGR02246 family)